MRLKNEMTEETNSHKVSRSLWLIWKHPDTGRYARIGQLDSLNNGDFVFSYESAEKLPKEFAPLAEFPDIQREYTAPGLPAFYANRVMLESRSAYGQYIDWLGVEPQFKTSPLKFWRELAASGLPIRSI